MRKPLFVLLWLLLFTTTRQYAAERTTPPGTQNTDIPPVDAVLILDVSHSMRHADPNRLAQEAMNLFIDMLGPYGGTVGVVSYAGHVVESLPLTAIGGQAGKDYIKNFINRQYYASWTDHSLGLVEAMRLMREGHNPEHRPIIILLTDGNKNLNPWGARTPEDAEYDLAQVLSEAAERSFPIHTIGLNYDGTLDQDYIDYIAAATGALSFETSSADNLLDIISAIIAEEMALHMVEIAEMLADGELLTIHIPIPSPYVRQADIIIMSNRPVTDISLKDPQNNPVIFDGANAMLSQSNIYALIRIMAPRQGDWTLLARGVDGDSIRVNLLYPEAPPCPALPYPYPPPSNPAYVPYSTPDSAAAAAYGYEDEYDDDDESAQPGRLLAVIVGVGLAAGVLIFMLMRIRRPKRIFIGKLLIEITDPQSGPVSPVLCNLTPYGRKTTLAVLLEGKAGPSLTQVKLTPSPNAPSHMPKLAFTCTSPEIRFRKGFRELSAAQGIDAGTGEVLTLQLAEGDTLIRLTYLGAS